MKKYNLENQIHFITLDTNKKIRLFNNNGLCRIIIDNLKFYRRKFAFKLFGFVIMPDHIHLLILLGKKHNNISRVMQDFKSHTAKEIINVIKTGRRKPSLSPYSDASEGSHLPQDYRWIEKGKIHTPSINKIWQKDFYDFNIYSEKKLEQKLNYIHYNPVRASLCKKHEDWKWSSYHNYFLDDNSVIKIDRL